MPTRVVPLPSLDKPVAHPMPGPKDPVVMDVLPWPNGYGFLGGDSWWQHVLNQSGRERLDTLMGLALLDPEICDQLVVKHDPDLLASFGLSGQMQAWLNSVQVSTLKELAQLIVSVTGERCYDDIYAGAD